MRPKVPEGFVRRSRRLRATARLACLCLGILALAVRSYGQSSNVEFVANIGGPVTAVHVAGNYAYVGEGRYLRVLDVSAPTTPTVVSQMPLANPAADIFVRNGLAYVAETTAGLQIVDVRNPSRPALCGTYDTSAPALAIHTSGTLAYVAAGIYGLHIFDVSNPSRPRLCAYFPTSGPATAVQVSGHLAYVGTKVGGSPQAGGLQIVDVADASRPSLVGSFCSSATVVALQVTGNLAYLLEEPNKLRIVDVSNPSRPVSRGVIGVGGGLSRVRTLGNLAYASGGKDWDNYSASGWVLGIDVSDPARPVVRTSLTTPARPLGMGISGAHVYLGAGVAGLLVFDVNESSQPTVRAIYNVPSTAQCVKVRGNMAYVTDWARGLQIFDISNPALPRYQGSFFLLHPPGPLTIENNLLYTVSNGALLIMDISVPSKPVLLSDGQPFPGVDYFFVLGNRAYCIASDLYWNHPTTHLSIRDVSDPSRPLVLGTYLAYYRNATDIWVSGTTAYLVSQYVSRLDFWYINPDGGLWFLDVSNPSAVGSIGAFMTTATGIFVSGNLAYLVHYGRPSLNIMDISTSQPRPVASCGLPAGASEVVVSGSQAYLAATDKGLQIVDVSDTSHPVICSSFDTPEYALGVDVSGGLIYLTDYHGGLWIFRQTSPRPPQAPSNAAARATSWNHISLSWQDNSNNETGFRVERKAGKTAPWTPIATASVKSNLFNRQSYEDRDVSPGRTYYYRVRSVSWTGTSAASNETSASIPYGPPAAPSHLWIGTWWPLPGYRLRWLDNADNETQFRVERKIGATGSWALLTTAPADLQSIVLTDLAPATTYSYRVRAYNRRGALAYSNVAILRTPDGPPAAPSNLIATALSANTIRLIWRDNSNNEHGFRIERKTTSTGWWSEIATVSADVTTYRDTALSTATAYSYRMRAYNDKGISPYLNEASTTTWEVPPGAPSHLVASSNSGTEIRLTWSDSSNNETGFEIMRRTGFDGPWAQIASVSANVTTYQDAGLTSNTAYWYRVLGSNSGGNSPPSNDAFCVTLPRPTNPRATALSYTAINLSWRDNSVSEEGFAIERRKEIYGVWSQIAFVRPNVTVFRDTALTTGTIYFYRVRAFTSLASTAYSNEEFAATWDVYPTAPMNLAITAVTSRTIYLTWRNTSHNAQGVKINRWTGPPWEGHDVATLPPNITRFQDRALTPLVTYYYRVRAYNVLGDSLSSNEVNTTTLEALPAPTNLRATAYSWRLVLLSWRDNSPDEIGFKIERRLGKWGLWQQIGTVRANDTTYADTGVSPETLYFYRVRAYKAGGPSAYSSIVPATTPPNRAASRRSWVLYP